MSGEQPGSKPSQQQVYDNVLKSSLQDQARSLLPVLLDGAEYVEALDGEALKPTSLRTDRCYLVRIRGKLKVVHVELETAADSEIAYRMLEYYGILYRAYKKPIIPIVLYPFRTTLPRPPLQVMDEDETVLLLRYRVIALWTFKAQNYLDRRESAMYTLLPTMEGANYERLLQALNEMKAVYSKQPWRLADHLLWFGTFLDRTDTMSSEDKRRIAAKMEDFISLLDQIPLCKREGRKAERKAGQRAERKAGQKDCGKPWYLL